MANEHLSHCQLRQRHHNLHLRYNAKNHKEVMRQHIEVVGELERRGLRHAYKDALDRETINQLARRRRDAKRRD